MFLFQPKPINSQTIQRIRICCIGKELGHSLTENQVNHKRKNSEKHVTKAAKLI
jgi:hypothetical protein